MRYESVYRLIKKKLRFKFKRQTDWENRKRAHSLVGKFHADRIISREILHNIMKKIWKTSEAFNIQKNVGKNLFIISFKLEKDKEWVLTGWPWLFDSYLFSLIPFDKWTPHGQIKFSKETFLIHLHNLSLVCMNEELRMQIDKTISNVEQCDVKERDKGWGCTF